MRRRMTSLAIDSYGSSLSLSARYSALWRLRLLLDCATVCPMGLCVAMATG